MAHSRGVDAGGIRKQLARQSLPESLVVGSCGLQGHMVGIGPVGLHPGVQLPVRHRGVVLCQIPDGYQVVLIFLDKVHLQLVGIGHQLLIACFVNHRVIEVVHQVHIQMSLRQQGAQSALTVGKAVVKLRAAEGHQSEVYLHRHGVGEEHDAVPLVIGHLYQLVLSHRHGECEVSAVDGYGIGFHLGMLQLYAHQLAPPVGMSRQRDLHLLLLLETIVIPLVHHPALVGQHEECVVRSPRAYVPYQLTSDHFFP